MANENLIPAYGFEEYSVATASEYVEFTIRTYQGTQSTDRTTGNTYTVVAKTLGGTARINVSPYVRDYLEGLFHVDGSLSNTLNRMACWVDVDRQAFTPGGSTGTLGTMADGYGILAWDERFQASKGNHESDKSIMFSDGGVHHIKTGATHSWCINRIEYDASGIRAERRDPDGTLDATSSYGGTFVDPTESDDIIETHDWTPDNTYTDYAHSVTGEGHELDFRPSNDVADNQFYFARFVNKQGGIQTYTFFGQPQWEETTKRKLHKVSAFNNVSNNLTNTRSNEIITDIMSESYVTLNTGFISEKNQMYLSELIHSPTGVWINGTALGYNRLSEYSNSWFPMNVVDHTMQWKRHQKHGMINHTLRLKTAFDRYLTF